ncbi:LeoA/HP0731 family dynamin-like GTPase [Proteiniclasticum sp. QWL-01]|uniref:LeoA/HP0731 family dynamin-like GTPase n=1 Tax=Proteiniclasticum sp. QWL-01 TaxID=3036945 RepID=UPI0024117316|nr:LeoA/HP0731 family dynamin-like GTPase [Proteiniclasticum sp. QWL-01]WFF73696.1 50S ribosome-binding GTPase [Proteiniclasticum sp. QWL-01]
METVEVFREKQKKTVEVLERLLAFLESGKKFGVKIDEKLIKKIENGINTTETERLKVVLIGGFSEGKTSIAAAWSEHYDKTTMKISQSESSNEIVTYTLGDIELIDTPGLFGFKETDDKEKYKDVTNKYVSESHLVLYVMNPYNPIKESHKEELTWLFKDLNILSRTVFVISRFDEEVDLEDNDSFERGLKIKKENILGRLRAFDIIQPYEDVSIVAISANPFGKGIDYWLGYLDEYKNLSRIQTLKEATTNKIKSVGSKHALILSSQKSIVKDIFLREMPIAQERVNKSAKECIQLNEVCNDIEKDLEKTKRKIINARTNLREFITNFFTNLILQAQGTNIETFNDFFQNNIGSEGVVLEARINNEFERQLGNTAREINRLNISFNAGVQHYTNVVGDLAFNGLKMGNEFLKNGFINIDNMAVLAARDMLKLPIKFKPWGAIKIANGINKAVPYVGAFIGIALDSWEAYDQNKKDKVFSEAISSMVSDFNEQRKEYLNFLNDEEKFIPQFFPEYLKLIDRINLIKQELENKEQQSEQFIQWKKEGEIIEVDFEEINKG